MDLLVLVLLPFEICFTLVILLPGQTTETSKLLFFECTRSGKFNDQ